MGRVLLIDADLAAYRAAAAFQKEFQWDENTRSVSVDEDAAKTSIKEDLDNWMSKLEASEFIICLSDDFNNFRKSIYADYKGNRTGARPEMLYPLKDWLFETFPSRRIPFLEADDILGIMSTEPHKGDRIMVSQDKDMRCIPGLLYRPYENHPELEVIDTEFADRWHLYQTLIGDQVDNYPGCPGVGPKAATECLDGLLGWESYEHEFQRGPRKGTTETRWNRVTFETPWEAVVSHFEKAGLTPRDALTQARVARILRNEDFDGGRPILWQP